VHYLARSKELTAVRLLTMHNLTFMQRLMERLRSQIAS
jgi:tRNA-guanine family transglycosylase